MYGPPFLPLAYFTDYNVYTLCIVPFTRPVFPPPPARDYSQKL